LKRIDILVATLGRLLREPLLHFLVIGVLMFGWSALHGVGTNASGITISRGVVDQLATAFVRSWGREPTLAELKSLVDDHVREEVAAREALSMGLDRDDTVVRRRLRQKVEFLLVDEVAATPVSDAEVAAWLGRHPEAFRTEPQVAFRQVFLRAQRRRTAANADAQALLQRLRAAGPEAAIESLGDSSMLPTESALQPLSEVERSFGADYADALAGLEVGQWLGPISSSFGIHLVLVRQHIDGGRPDPAAVRPQVEREVLSERRAAAMDALYRRLLTKYDITIDLTAVARGTP
jgi:hypothetical protein